MITFSLTTTPQSRGDGGMETSESGTAAVPGVTVEPGTHNNTSDHTCAQNIPEETALSPALAGESGLGQPCFIPCDLPP